MGTSCVIKPIKLNVRAEAVAGAVNTYLPSVPVMAPIVVPLTVTFTPGRASPSSELVTVPVICTVWLITREPVIRNSVKINRIFFINIQV
jgi:hypothetical protein